MLNINVQSKDVGDGFEVTTSIKGSANAKEIKTAIITILKGFTDTTDEDIVLSALEKFCEERMNK